MTKGGDSVAAFARYVVAMLAGIVVGGVTGLLAHVLVAKFWEPGGLSWTMGLGLGATVGLISAPIAHLLLGMLAHKAPDERPPIFAFVAPVVASLTAGIATSLAAGNNVAISMLILATIVVTWLGVRKYEIWEPAARLMTTLRSIYGVPEMSADDLVERMHRIARDFHDQVREEVVNECNGSELTEAIVRKVAQTCHIQPQAVRRILSYSNVDSSSYASHMLMVRIGRKIRRFKNQGGTIDDDFYKTLSDLYTISPETVAKLQRLFEAKGA
jgi:hypothetical protein